jgi:hypothetical protein
MFLLVFLFTQAFSASQSSTVITSFIVFIQQKFTHPGGTLEQSSVFLHRNDSFIIPMSRLTCEFQ